MGQPKECSGMPRMKEIAVRHQGYRAGRCRIGQRRGAKIGRAERSIIDTIKSHRPGSHVERVAPLEPPLLKPIASNKDHILGFVVLQQILVENRTPGMAERQPAGRFDLDAIDVRIPAAPRPKPDIEIAAWNKGQRVFAFGELDIPIFTKAECRPDLDHDIAAGDLDPQGMLDAKLGHDHLLIGKSKIELGPLQPEIAACYPMNRGPGLAVVGPSDDVGREVTIDHRRGDGRAGDEGVGRVENFQAAIIGGDQQRSRLFILLELEEISGEIVAATSNELSSRPHHCRPEHKRQEILLALARHAEFCKINPR